MDKLDGIKSIRRLRRREARWKIGARGVVRFLHVGGVGALMGYDDALRCVVVRDEDWRIENERVEYVWSIEGYGVEKWQENVHRGV